MLARKAERRPNRIKSSHGPTLNVLADQHVARPVDDADAVADAADQIDALLSRSSNVGESRSDNERILAISPLSVRYDVLSDDFRLEVHAVWRF